MAEKMKFIRKNGRVIPIKAKGSKEPVKQVRQKADKQDFLTGLGHGLTTSLFHKRFGVKVASSLLSIGSGVQTSRDRFKSEKTTGSAVLQDIKGSFIKSGGALAGMAVGFGSLVGLNKLKKTWKAWKVFNMSKFKKLGAIAKTLGITTAVGYLTARAVSSTDEGPQHGKRGAQIGFALGSASMIAPKVMKSQTFKDTAKFVFRRVRGKIIPIKVK